MSDIFLTCKGCRFMLNNNSESICIFNPPMAFPVHTKGAFGQQEMGAMSLFPPVSDRSPRCSRYSTISAKTEN